MKIRTVTCLALLSFFSAVESFAVTTTAEPYLGYAGLGGMTLNSNTGSGALGSVSGVVVGARGLVGFLQLFFAGLDLSYSPLSYSAPAAGSAFASETMTSVNSLKLGLVAGVELPIIPLRFWLGYNLVDRLSATDGTGSVTGTGIANTPFNLSGGSLKAGVGYKFLPILSANLEFLASAYSSYSVNGGASTSYPSGSNFTNTSLILSLSAPLTF